MIVGAFDGRTRRADAEERFREANPVPEDARERYKRGISKSPVDRPLNTQLTALSLCVGGCVPAGAVAWLERFSRLRTRPKRYSRSWSNSRSKP